MKKTVRGFIGPTAEHVRNLAMLADVSFNELYVDRWAIAVTELTDDEVKSDSTDDLLVALIRSGNLTPKDMVTLLMQHHRELKHI